ncbi:MAG: hypothetical protein KDA71_04225, partial [Planctomycetales bacterium]|nr:hypothetical protein [Planctomycetales bacterium]
VYSTVSLISTPTVKKGQRSAPTVQFEYELLDNGRQLFSQHPDKFAAFFGAVEQAYGAKIDARPKVAQGASLLGLLGGAF